MDAINQPLLDVRDLSVVFHQPSGISIAVDRISYSIRRGECVALVGESGSGKSVSALSILSELILLAPTMTVRQWVASSGLDPVHQQSGTSQNKPSRISRAGNRRLRASLYMSALSAARYDRHLAAFYRALRARHKTGLQALMAVARKMLHAIYGIFKSGTPYDGRRLFPNIQIEVESIAG